MNTLSNVPRDDVQRSTLERSNVQRNWPDSKEFWHDKRVVVTGGAGFLGSFVVEKLRERGAAEIIVPRSKDYDLRDIDAIRQLFVDTLERSTPNVPTSSSSTSLPTSAASAPTAPIRPSSSMTT